MKARIALLALLSLTVVTVSAQPYMSSDGRDVAFKSQQIMSPVSRYTGTTFMPFGNEVPSDQTEVGRRNAPGTNGPRKGKITGPDTPPANEYPVGEPWILLLFAATFAGVITLRRKSSTK